MHFYREVDPRFLLRETEVNASTYQQSQLATPRRTLGGPANLPFPNPEYANDPVWFADASPEQAWWDLHVCSVCRKAFTVSRLDDIPSVLGADLCQKFEEVRRQKPTPDGPDVTMREALDYIWKVLRNLLYRGERAGIPWTGATFLKRMGDSQVA
jgi:hypothetical protein